MLQSKSAAVVIPENTGTLKVFVTTAHQSLPIQGATVEISDITPDGERELLYVLTTNESGETQPINLPAPVASLSQLPGEIGKSYALYNIRIDKDGYYPVIARNVAVFPGITSIQPFSMIPVSDEDFYTGQKDRPIVFRDFEPNELEGS